MVITRSRRCYTERSSTHIPTSSRSHTSCSSPVKVRSRPSADYARHQIPGRIRTKPWGGKSSSRSGRRTWMKFRIGISIISSWIDGTLMSWTRPCCEPDGVQRRIPEYGRSMFFGFGDYNVLGINANLAIGRSLHTVCGVDMTCDRIPGTSVLSRSDSTLKGDLHSIPAPASR